MENIKLLSYIVSVLSFILFIPQALANGGYGMIGGDFGWGWFGMGFGFIFMIIFWGIIIYFIMLAFKSFTDKNEKDTPLDLLKKRLAKGEISEDEFEKLKKKL